MPTSWEMIDIDSIDSMGPSSWEMDDDLVGSRSRDGDCVRLSSQEGDCNCLASDSQERSDCDCVGPTSCQEVHSVESMWLDDDDEDEVVCINHSWYDDARNHEVEHVECIDLTLSEHSNGGTQYVIDRWLDERDHDDDASFGESCMYGSMDSIEDLCDFRSPVHDWTP